MEESEIQRGVKFVLGALGLGAVAAVFSMPKIGSNVALLILGIILLLAVLLFGGFYFWRRNQNRRRSRAFNAAIEAQSSSIPREISDPKARGQLDNLRQKFQEGLQDYRKSGKDIYSYPWYVIIGESGSGKTEAIRHSEIPFPRGLNKERQGSGGTVNMDWWFTNKGIVLDTAGSMIFNEVRTSETSEWREFLRLLRKARPHCPINGLFLVLSVESLIKDSAEKISEKAHLLGNQLDLIQKTLDVRFPVYLLVTKCDLLTGFREFFDRIDDPQLQHQIFGWSNADELDAHFNPDLLEEHLQGIAERVRRRRLGLLYDAQSGGDTAMFYRGPGGGAPASAALDDVDALFALPESIMRLAPRLKRYVETIFQEGEWSAKPVFLRGVYFTSSMREGRTLDEAMSFAANIPLDQLPEEGRAWDRNRAFFLRDLFMEKVFCESGLVTRATNTLRLLRQRKFAIFGSAAAALLLLLLFAGLSYRTLRRDITDQAKLWKAGSTNWHAGEWQPIVTNANGSVYGYAGSNLVPETSQTLVEYLAALQKQAERPIHFSLIFRPIDWIKKISGSNIEQRRRAAYSIITERSVVGPLVERTRAKMGDTNTPLGSSENRVRLRNALLRLLDFHADALAPSTNKAQALSPAAATNYLRAFIPYLTESDQQLDPSLVSTVVSAYTLRPVRDEGKSWPPPYLRGANSLSNYPAIDTGLGSFHSAGAGARTNLTQELSSLNRAVDDLTAYKQIETGLLSSDTNICSTLGQTLAPAKKKADDSLAVLNRTAGGPAVTNFAKYYDHLRDVALLSSAYALIKPLSEIRDRVPEPLRPKSLFSDVERRLQTFGDRAANEVEQGFTQRSKDIKILDESYITVSATNRTPQFELRWILYSQACAIASQSASVEDSDFGSRWAKYTNAVRRAKKFEEDRGAYAGEFQRLVLDVCQKAAGESLQRFRRDYLTNYLAQATRRLGQAASNSRSFFDVTNSAPLFRGVEADNESRFLLEESDAEKVHKVISKLLSETRDQLVQTYVASVQTELARQIRFPVVRSKTDPMTPQQLEVLARTFDRIQAELTNVVWQSFPKSDQLLRPLRENKSRDLVNILMGSGEPKELAEVELFYVPSPADVQIKSVLRDLFIDSGEGAPRSRLPAVSTAGALPLGTTRINTPLKISHGYEMPQVTSIDVKEWGFIRLIHDHQAVRQANGAWRLSLSLTANGASGPILLEFRLKNPPQLPALEEWPEK